MPSSLRSTEGLPPPIPPPSPPSRVRKLCATGATLAAWYCISTAIILTTKWLFNNHFSFPLTVTTFSNTVTTFWALLISRRPKWRPEPLTRRQFFNYVLPIGITTALEIGFSNIALKLLTVTFGTILKGGAPIFTMFWGLLFYVETFSFNLLLSLLTIALGIALASLGEGHTFSLTGFILQLLATALGGLRWAMTHVLLKGSSSDAMPPLTATLYTSPTTALCVLPFAVGLEGIPVWDRINQFDPGEFRIVFLTMLFVASLVFILLVSEYWLVNATSSLALSVAGVLKELLTIGGGIFLFKEHVSFLNTIGFIICQMGIFAYMYLRYEPNNGISDSHHQYIHALNTTDNSIISPDDNNDDLVSIIDSATTIHDEQLPNGNTQLNTSIVSTNTQNNENDSQKSLHHSVNVNFSVDDTDDDDDDNGNNNSESRSLQSEYRMMNGTAQAHNFKPSTINNTS